MLPQPTFCPNIHCTSRSIQGAGNLKVHDSLRNRWRCSVCHKTFSGRKGTPVYQLKTDPQIFTWVIALLAYGCPLKAAVAAFELDERTVRTWQKKAGQHCEAVHNARVQIPQNLEEVQADEIRVRFQKRLAVWLAMAICVPTRLWLGGVVSGHRDKFLAHAIAKKIKACAEVSALLVVTDGWRPYKEAFVHAFRFPEYSGERGRPRLICWSRFALSQIVKWQEAGRVPGIRVCRLYRNWRQISFLLPRHQVLNTAYIERLNATFRQRLCGLCRRTRCLLREEATLASSVYLVGTVYNFCTLHKSLTRDKQKRTPAMAAGITKYCWSVEELLSCRIAPPPYVAPKRRGRPPGKTAHQEQKGANQLVTV